MLMSSQGSESTHATAELADFGQRARILDGCCTKIGCGVAHEFCMKRARGSARVGHASGFCSLRLKVGD
jgi:hypothetical protein